VSGRPAHGATRPGAVVIGGDYQGLGIARSLGRRGVPVLVIDSEPSIAPLSRFVGRSVRVRDLRDEARTIESLLHIGRRHGLAGWVLYPTREETVAACSRHREALAEVFSVATPPWDVVRWAWDKRRTQEAAERAGVPTAKTWWPRDRAELDAVAADAAFPLLLKPAIKEHFVYATGEKAWRVDTREELLSRHDEATAIAGPGEMMVQELLPGDGRHRLAFCAMVHDGRAVGSLVARRTRQFPPDFGRHSTFVETVDVPAIEHAAMRFLREIGYSGLVEVEFMLDERDGHPKLLDVNARTWGYHSIGAHAGVDFPWLLYAAQVGLPTETARGRSGVRWIRLVTDTPTALREVLRGRLGMRRYLRSLRGIDAEAAFSWDDPVPALAELLILPYVALARGY
jgi:predicted ATP-grasp superfamily ATP-dependent carboligase